MRELLVTFRASGRRGLLTVLCGLSGCGLGDKGERESSRTAWAVATEPALLVGAVGSGATVAFHSIAGTVRLSDGRIVVADGGLSSRLTVLAPNGDSLMTIGRLGEGPGEYQWITSLEAGANDSLYVFDAAQQRLTVFTRDGRLGRTATFRGAGRGMLRSVSLLTDSVWLARGLDHPLRGPVDRIVRDTISFGLLDANLSGMQILTRLPTLMSMTFSVHGRALLGSALFSPMALQATWGRCVFLSTAEDSSIEVYSATGAHVVDIRAPGRRRRVTSDDVNAFVQARLEQASTAQDTAIAEAFGRTTHPEYLPYFNQMVVDEWGDIWLEEYSPPLGSGGRWHVITQSGEDLGTVVMPPKSGIFEIGEKGVLGVATGKFGEPIVVVLPLISRPSVKGSTIAKCRRTQ